MFSAIVSWNVQLHAINFLRSEVIEIYHRQRVCKGDSEFGRAINARYPHTVDKLSLCVVTATK